MIIPSIDIMGGKAVQLRQGKEKVLEREDVLALARDFSRYGELAVIDLDAAMGKGDNLQLVKEICKIADCRVGGGIRTICRAREILRAGAKKIVIGTMAKKEFLEQLPQERVIVAVDAKNGLVMGNGWTTSTGKKANDVIAELENYCSGFLFTNVDKEGMMGGVDYGLLRGIRRLTKKELTAAGGITTIDDIKKIEGLPANSQIGMALYTGKISLDGAFASLLDWEKNSGIIPTIVQDCRGQVLMMAYSSEESLSKALVCGKGIYYSRSRKKVWEKGETSGNSQELIRAKYDCDRDTLLFTVRQKNAACHEEKYSCFGEKEFGFEELYGIIYDRLAKNNLRSYTSRLRRNDALLKKKILEEAKEIASFTSKDNLIWEIADLIYFVSVLMAKNSVSWGDVKNELSGRRR